MIKYEFTGEKAGSLKRIRALKDFSFVKAGELGGWIESKSNLSHSDNAWVSGNAQVSGSAQVFGNAQVSGSAQVSGNAWVFGNARVYGSAQVFGSAQVSGSAQVFGNAQVSGSARVSGNAWVFGSAQVSSSARVFGINRSDGYCFCYAPDKETVFRVMAGCRYFTMAEAREHWANTREGTPLGDETMCILDAIEALHKVKPDGCV